MSKSININQKIAIIGCGYWGTMLVNSLINIGFKNVFVHAKNLKNVKILKQKVITCAKKINSFCALKHTFISTPIIIRHRFRQ